MQVSLWVMGTQLLSHQDQDAHEQGVDRSQSRQDWKLGIPKWGVGIPRCILPAVQMPALVTWHCSNINNNASKILSLKEYIYSECF